MIDFKALPIIALLVALAILAQCVGGISHAATILAPNPTHIPRTLEEALELDRMQGRCYSAVDRYMMRHRARGAHWRPVAGEC